MNLAVGGSALLGSPNQKSVYISYLVYLLLERDSTLRVYALCFSDDKDRQKLITHKRLEYIYLPIKRSSYENKAKRFGKLADISKHISADIDAVIYPDAIAWPLLKKARKSILVIHDVAHIEYPQSIDKQRLKLLSKLVPKSIEESTFILTLSNHSEAQIKNTYGTNKPTVVAPPAFNTTIFNNEIQAGDPATLVKHSLPEDYILHLGTLKHGKNISEVLDVYSLLDDDLRNKYALVLAGHKGVDPETDAAVAVAQQKGLNVITPGAINPRDMGALYRMANVFISLSFYESVGMPIIEAMASGTPVVCSSIPAYVDAVGEAGMVVKVGDTKEAARTLTRVLKDSDIYDDMVKTGLERVNSYSWAHTVDAVQNLL